jgi:hypothetical protein
MERRVKFLKPWRRYRPGDSGVMIVELARTLMDHGIVEWADGAGVESMTLEAPENAMANPAPKRRRGRPKKAKGE